MINHRCWWGVRDARPIVNHSDVGCDLNLMHSYHRHRVEKELEAWALVLSRIYSSRYCTDVERSRTMHSASLLDWIVDVEEELARSVA